MELILLDRSKALIIKRMFSLVVKTQKQSINLITKTCGFLIYDTKTGQILFSHTQRQTLVCLRVFMKCFYYRSLQFYTKYLLGTHLVSANVLGV